MMMMYENQTAVRQSSVSSNTSSASLPTTPKFVRKFHNNFRPLDLRKLTLHGSQSVEEPSTSFSSASSCSQSSTANSSQENSPRDRRFGSASFHSNSHDSFMLKRQSSQNRLRESLLSSLLSPRSVHHYYLHVFLLQIFCTAYVSLDIIQNHQYQNG